MDTAKPQPDIVEVALDRAGVTASRAVFVGDAVWDVVACGRAGVAAIALRSGGVSRDELEQAGARLFSTIRATCATTLRARPTAALADADRHARSS